ncbi:C40 family peptidase [Ciceribacter sp. L1K22]|nr:C40 family peptidase [Ciceribacter sp. L1K22]
MDGARIVALAEAWIGTPYRHQGSEKGVGCDCLGLVRGLWRELYGEEPETPGAYCSDWAERGGGERLLQAAGRHMARLPGIDAAAPGDLIIFRFRPQLPAKHCGILVGGGRFIHAYEQAGVVSSALVPAWRKRVAGVFGWVERRR